LFKNTSKRFIQTYNYPKTLEVLLNFKWTREIMILVYYKKKLSQEQVYGVV